MEAVFFFSLLSSSSVLSFFREREREKRGIDKKTYGVRDTQLQDPSTVDTCVMLNRIDKWEGRWNNAV